MACTPRVPTGEKAAPQFVAPQFVPTQTAQTQRFIASQLQAIEADLRGLHAAVAPAPQTLALEATGGTVQAREGQTIRVTPPVAGTVILLPQARPANKGQEVTVLVEGSAGPVTLRATEALVQGQAEVTLSGLGLRVLRSDGSAGWWIVGQSSADSGNQLVAISAGTNLATSGTVRFSNGSGVTFGMNTGGVITASVSTGIGLTAPGSTTTVTGIAFSNNNNMSWSVAGATQIIGRPFVIASVVGSTFDAVSRLAFNSANGVTFGISTSNNNAATITASIASSLTNIRISAGAGNELLSAVTLSNSNGVSFGINASTVTASHDGLRTVSIFAPSAANLFSITNATSSTLVGLSAAFPALSTDGNTRFSQNNVLWRISSNSMLAAAFQEYIGGTTNHQAQYLSFLNANGLTWGINTVTATNRGIIPFVSASFSTLSFSNANNVSFGIAGSTLTATVTVASTQASVLVNGLLSSAFTFSNSNNVSFGIDAGGVVTATATVAATRDIGIVSHIGGNVVSSVSRLAFSNASNVTWSLSTAANAATIIASVAAGGGGGGIAASAAGSSQSAGTVVWSNANNVSFGMNGSTITATVTVASSLTNIRISAGTEAFLGSQLSFADSHNIAFGLNVSTITARASAVALAASGATATTGTVVLTNDAFVTAAAVLASKHNVAFSLNGQTLQATAVMGFRDGTDSTGTNNAHRVTKVQLLDGNGITFGFATNNDADGGRQAVLTASRLQDIGLVSHVGGNVQSSVTRLAFSNTNGVSFSLSTAASAVTVQASIDTGPTARYYRNFVNISSSQVIALAAHSNSMILFPLGFAPFPGDMTASQMDLLVSGNASTESNLSYGFTIRGGIYTVDNSTRLSLVNSFSFTSSGQSTASLNRQSSVQGIRWLPLSSSNWSAAPRFSLGANYWMLIGFRHGGINCLSNLIGCSGPNMNVGANFAGSWGVNGVAAISSRFSPFQGSINTTSPPNNLASAALLCDSNMSVWAPYLQLRADVHQ